MAHAGGEPVDLVVRDGDAGIPDRQHRDVLVVHVTEHGEQRRPARKEVVGVQHHLLGRIRRGGILEVPVLRGDDQLLRCLETRADGPELRNPEADDALVVVHIVQADVQLERSEVVGARQDHPLHRVAGEVLVMVVAERDRQRTVAVADIAAVVAPGHLFPERNVREEVDRAELGAVVADLVAVPEVVADALRGEVRRHAVLMPDCSALKVAACLITAAV
ncbi:unnamed protein product [Brugia timori]|uniref:Uncharacterized protein n=1 Tax=Brugia timori TaxID=42155 RepID=A0A0R3QQM3_9BILA|nr:unnamed protein product [Brugia timori]